MILQVSHESLYSYSGEVMPGLHYLHFHPQQRSYLNVREFSIRVDPSPDALTARTDAENNLYHQCWFSDPTTRMEIHTSFRVVVSEFNPFEFLIDNQGPQGTESYQVQTQKFLTPYLEERHIVSTEMSSFVRRFENENPVDLIVGLSEAIAKDWDHRERFEDNILDSEACFSQRSGSCRDLARMMMALLRYKGMPARFVSGYAYVEGGEEGHELHAWVEAFIPGAGWIGADPSFGLLTTERYIPVATSFDPRRTMPIQGFYRGEASSALETAVVIREVQP